MHYEPTFRDAIKHVAVNFIMTVCYIIIFGAIGALWIIT